MTKRRPLVAGNWKMNGLLAGASEVADICEAKIGDVDVVVCPPSPLIMDFAECAEGSRIQIGAQDCHPNDSGAHTGDVSVIILKDVGASAVIVGHSERRADHGETSAHVKSKAEAVLSHGLLAVVCVGETEAERDEGNAEAVVVAQMEASLPNDVKADSVVVAYEPVWAIGTGRTPTNEQIGSMHAALRSALIARIGDEANGVRLLYGGSVKPGNAAEIFAIDDVDGGLIGGASLKAEDFLGIVQAAG